MKDMTLINVILDRSGSMSIVAEDAVGGFNNFLKEQQEPDDYAELSLFQFDDQYQIDYTRRPIKECEPLELGNTYQPRGWTALLDAIGKTVNTIGEELKGLEEEERPARVLFMILTDGHENKSTEFNKSQIKEMIEHQKEAYKWDFIFLAAGIDAFAEAGDMSFAKHKTASFDHSAAGVRGMSATMSDYTTSYRSTGDNTAEVKKQDRV
jgi:hypothetical protein